MTQTNDICSVEDEDQQDNTGISGAKLLAWLQKKSADEVTEPVEIRRDRYANESAVIFVWSDGIAASCSF